MANKEKKIKPGMYERICVVPDDRLVIVDDYGCYLPEEDFAQFEPDLAIIDYWGLETAELQYHTPARFNETIDDLDFLEPLIEKHRIQKDIEINRLTDPLYGLTGEELKKAKKEKDKYEAGEKFYGKVQGKTLVSLPEGDFYFTANGETLLDFIIFSQGAMYSGDRTVELFDADGNMHSLAISSVNRIISVLSEEYRGAKTALLLELKEIDSRV